MHRQYPSNQPCPCNSGLNYIDCCLDRIGPTWGLDEKGEVVKILNLDEHSEKILKNQKNGSDKAFPEAQVEEFMSNLAKAILSSGVIKSSSKAIWFYIFLKEELVLSEKNIPMLPTGDRMLCIQAAAEYVKEDKDNLLKPFKEILKDDYDTVLELFKKYPGDKKDIENYIEMLSNDSVFEAYKKMDAKRNDPCPCGSGKKFKKCCGA